jgi:hypothetical protein
VSDPTPHHDTPLEAYDHNCIFPICEMRSDKVLVTPFIPSLHAQLYLNGSNQDPYGIFRWVPWGPFNDLPEMLRFCETMRADRSVAFFAVRVQAPVRPMCAMEGDEPCVFQVFDLASGQPQFAGVLKLYQCNLDTLVSDPIRPPLPWSSTDFLLCALFSPPRSATCSSSRRSVGRTSLPTPCRSS